MGGHNRHESFQMIFEHARHVNLLTGPRVHFRHKSDLISCQTNWNSDVNKKLVAYYVNER